MTGPTGGMAAGFVVSGLTAYGFLVVTARAVGPARFASLSVLWALTLLVGPGLFLPLEQELARAIATRRATGVGFRPVVRRVATAGVVVCAVVLLTGLAAGRVVTARLFDHQALLFVALLGALVAYQVQHLARGLLAGTMSFGRYGLLIGSEGVLRLAAGIALVAVGVRSSGPFGLCLTIGSLACVAVALRGAHIPLEVGPVAEWREVTRSLGWLLASSLLAQGLLNAAPLAVKILARRDQSASAGRFLAALVVARVPLFLFQPVQSAILPHLATLAAGHDRSRLRRALAIAVGVVGGVGALGVLGALIAGPTVLRVFFGAHFVLARLDLALLAAAAASYLMAQTFTQALVAISAFRVAATGWLIGLVTFFIPVIAVHQLFRRTELGYLAGTTAAAVTLLVLLATRTDLASSATTDEPVALNIPSPELL